jgi:hypothetical protein
MTKREIDSFFWGVTLHPLLYFDDMAPPAAAPRRFKVSNRFKKTVVETELWRKGDCYFTVESVWRWGSFVVVVQDGEEVPVHGDPTIDLEDYQEWEDNDTSDCCACDLTYEGSSPSAEENEKEEERVKAGYNDECNMWLEYDGWTSVDRNFRIDDEIDVEELVDAKPDANADDGPVEA